VVCAAADDDAACKTRINTATAVYSV